MLDVDLNDLAIATWWMRHAACADADPSWFFTEFGSTVGVEAGLAICRSCPVVDECYDYAMRERIEWGTWGGRTAAQRARSRRS